MTKRLYKQRIRAYPKAMKLTEPLRSSKLKDFKGDTNSFLRSTRQQLEEWHSNDAAFIVSRRTLKCIYRMRDTLSLVPENPFSFTEDEVQTIFEAKNALRKSLTNDMYLLFGEDESFNGGREI